MIINKGQYNLYDDKLYIILSFIVGNKL